MPNRFTRIPTSAVPALPTWLAPVVLVADAFMLVMISRPSTGSLRNTWVTPGTLQLCALSVPLFSVVGIWLLLRSASILIAVLGILFIAFAAASLAVLAVGVIQRHADA